VSGSVFRVRMEELFGSPLRDVRQKTVRNRWGDCVARRGTVPVTPPNVIKGLRSAHLVPSK